MKQLWLLAGANGSGKSTFYHTQLEPLGLPFINADIIAREFFPNAPEAHSYDAAKIAEEIRQQLLFENRSFCFETVFSHPTKIDFVARAKSLGFEVILVFIHLDFVELNKARVSQRVREGGHFVPDDKVESRVPRTLANVKATLPLCDQARFLDNSSAFDPFRPVATYKNGLVTYHDYPPTEWLVEMFSEVETIN